MGLTGISEDNFRFHHAPIFLSARHSKELKEVQKKLSGGFSKEGTYEGKKKKNSQIFKQMCEKKMKKILEDDQEALIMILSITLRLSSNLFGNMFFKIELLKSHWVVFSYLLK